MSSITCPRSETPLRPCTPPTPGTSTLVEDAGIRSGPVPDRRRRPRTGAAGRPRRTPAAGHLTATGTGNSRSGQICERAPITGGMPGNTPDDRFGPRERGEGEETGQ
ncbi:hypothetical protein GCM10023085_17840 [Actinomadura viridis]